jgi:hypothetical protein
MSQHQQAVKLTVSSLSDALAGWLENSKTVKKAMKSLINS